MAILKYVIEDKAILFHINWSNFVNDTRAVMYATLALDMSEYIFNKMAKRNPRQEHGYQFYYRYPDFKNEIDNFQKSMMDVKMRTLHGKMVQCKFLTK